MSHTLTASEEEEEAAGGDPVRDPRRPGVMGRRTLTVTASAASTAGAPKYAAGRT
jgi:hypothetical protein